MLRSTHDTTIQAYKAPFIKVRSRLNRLTASGLLRLQRLAISDYNSLSLFSSISPEYINNSHADIVNLHWIQGETLSIRAIASLTKPFVWTLHDMWPFCGTEHYSIDLRWKNNYDQRLGSNQGLGLDLARWNYLRKKTLWQRRLHLVAPSSWMAQCIYDSTLLQHAHVEVIHNPIDTAFWRPCISSQARSELGLPPESKLILFGASGSIYQRRKGLDLLYAALKHLKQSGDAQDTQLVVLGSITNSQMPNIDFPVHFMGNVGSERKLRSLYSAVDAFVLPSRQDNLPNMAVEAQSCGLPVVAFDIGGLRDIVEHLVTGYLASPYSVRDLAAGIIWALSRTSSGSTSEACRSSAIRKFEMHLIAGKYNQYYEKVLESYYQKRNDIP